MESIFPVIIDPVGTNIHAEAERIRAHGPVAQVELPGGVTAWSITSYASGRRALADHRLSKDPRKHWTAFIRGEIGPDFPLIGWALMENLTTTHGSDHSRLRRLIAKAFTPRRVEDMRPKVERIAVGLLDRLAADGRDGVVDLKAGFAHPLAAQVICELIGMPEAEGALMLRGGDANVDTTLTAEAKAAIIAQVHRDMGAFIAAKRQKPGDDLTSDLIAAQEEDGSRLNDAELKGTLLLLLATGTEPVTNLVTNAARHLLTDYGQRDLIATGQASWRDLIEETLRVEAPVAHLPFRFAVSDIELGGVTIPKGAPVLVNFAGIGRDPAVHGASAACFDITRPNKEHLSFGYGIYRCIGMPLGLLETETALRSLFKRFPGLALAVSPDELEPQATFIMNGYRALPAYLNPAAETLEDRRSR